MAAPPKSLRTLIDRFDPDAFDGPPRGVRIRMEVDGDSWDAVIKRGKPTLGAPNGSEPDALLSADEASWERIARDVRGGMEAFRDGRLHVRRNLHLGVGLLAATSGTTGPGRMRFESVKTGFGRVSVVEAGVGDPVLCLHGLGGTKASFLPTLAALAEHHRVIAMDLPGFGDSVKPIGARYDAAWFARTVFSLMDALEIDRVHLAGNSMGGRVALEAGLMDPPRVGRLVMLSPALAWLRDRRYEAVVRLLRPELGLVQMAPRPVVEGIVRRLIPGARNGWAAAGVDEFLRAYLTPRGRAAFYAAARNIYLDRPDGDDGFWPRLEGLEPDTLFVWGREDTLVPIAFMRHVERALPGAEHLELDCGHVPQLEQPHQTHLAMRKFFARAPLG